MKKVVALVLAMLAPAAALAQPPDYAPGVNGNLRPVTPVYSVSGGLYGGMTAVLLANVSAPGTGTPVPHVYKDSYFYTCSATSWNGASAQLQYLGPDASTWINFSGGVLTANGVLGVGIGANSTIRVLVTGTPTALFCNLT